MGIPDKGVKFVWADFVMNPINLYCMKMNLVTITNQLIRHLNY